MLGKYLTIPVVWFKKDLTSQEMFILSEIVGFCKNNKTCFAHNEHFAKKLNIAKPNVSRVINSLVSKGFITSKIKKGSRNNVRYITVNKMILKSYQNDTDEYQNDKRPISTKLIKSKTPTLVEIKAYIASRNSIVNATKFFEYYEVDDWKGIKNWKQKLLTWERYNKKDKTENKGVNKYDRYNS